VGGEGRRGDGEDRGFAVPDVNVMGQGCAAAQCDALPTMSIRFVELATRAAAVCDGRKERGMLWEG
jgi:hypothetical protein